ncbi:HpcH/HpaI aldolase/citrate lyase family protein [Sulfurimonas sp. SAG-AH-194-C21]|nr:HpcH/HpaI aldolase/citrate lyase family protein [Sulfurimonas sp. SAG-AH-194-C21]MDF1883447.1 HpcH/HpaI aldolase/citrate lyase family protein [Sulfurimonas sp. SAG-AH-194-C21]
MKNLDYLELGGTLFIPASHKRLKEIVCDNKYPHLKSVVIDFEDGLEHSDFEFAMQNINNILENITSKTLLTFIRAKNTQHLSELLRLSHIDKIRGFVLAKFSLANAEIYLNLLSCTNHIIMPSIEGEELFNHQKLHLLKEMILTNKHKVLLVRFGLEDMLKQLSMKRKCDESIFDLSAPASVVGNFIATFKSAGFGVSAGVYPCYRDKVGFIKDVKRDIKEGLLSKTIIHPSQIALINEIYKVQKREYEEATEIVNSQKKVFALNGKMAESVTMSSYSLELIHRAKIYGFKDE